MPLLRLIAEGVGPFERLDIDLSDGKGNPHLGPHIFAGVNGSGKSTVLRTLAWVMDRGGSGFSYPDWAHLLAGHRDSRALLAIKPHESAVRVAACATNGRVSVGDLTDTERRERLVNWVRSELRSPSFDDSPLASLGLEAFEGTGLPVSKTGAYSLSNNAYSLSNTAYPFPQSYSAGPDQPEGTTRVLFRDVGAANEPGLLFNAAAYSPSRALRHLAAVDLTRRLEHAQENALSFEGTVQNDVVQSWLVGLYSKRAIARARQQSGDQYTRTLDRFENALRLLYDKSVSFDVELEPNLQPCLKAFGRNLDFSQLPDGVRSTVGWIADYMMRQDLAPWHPSLKEKRPGVLLLDEVDAHLHPLWQRKLLPAMREALPDVQILVTSHSPFVISSCPGSRVHVLDLDSAGHATVRLSEDAPIGESVTATLKEIFGVESRFDVLTERQLDDWNTLKKRDVTGSLSATDKARLKELTITLAERSEELRSIVASPMTIPDSVVRSLTEPKRKKRA